MNLKRLEARQINEEMLNKKQFETLNKMNNKTKSVEEILILKEKDNDKVIQINNVKYNNVLNEAKNIKELNKEKKEEISKLFDRKKEKIEDFKNNKIINNEIQTRINEIINNNRREYELELKQIYHNKKIDDNIIEKIRNKFPDNYKINDILEKLRVVEEEEKQENERKKRKA